MGSAQDKDEFELVARGPSRDVADLIRPTVAKLGFDLVRVKLGGGDHPTLQIMAEPKDGRDMSVEDCGTISRALSALLDEQDPITSAYTLEVSSPGIDRPLTRVKDFERWQGFVVKIETTHPVEGRKKFTGKLAGLDGQDVMVGVSDTETVKIPLSALAQARLVINDELLAAVRNAA